VATENMDFRERYREIVAFPAWLQGLVVVAVAGMVAALIIPAITADGGWRFYAQYYPVMGLATLVTVTVMLNFRHLTIVVTDEEVRFRFGIFGTSFPLEAVRTCEVKRYQWLPYGGWGLRMASGGRMAYSVLGVPRGVEITAERKGKLRRYFVSSVQPEVLAAAFGR